STSKTPSYTKSVSWQHHRRLLIQAANFTEKQTVEPEPQPQSMPVDDGGPGCLGVIKIIFYIFIFAGLIGKILHLFG
ncbi:hypothetical protein HEN07_022225, partial [Escherichia coli]|nr:hypothetical protein [Escherichia coli]